MDSFHPLARANIKQLGFPGPMASVLHPEDATEDCIHLEENINAFGGPFNHYPDLLQQKLKQKYLTFLWDVEAHALAAKNHSPLEGESRSVATRWGGRRGTKANHNLPLSKGLLTSDHILFTTGAADALSLVLTAFAEPK